VRRVPAREGSFEISSRLAAPAAEVWAFATTAEGVNAELMPIVRMTVPRGVDDLDIADVVAPIRLGRSWLLLGGLIPFDWDDIGIERLGPGFAFSERSTMLSQRAWHHDRRVEPRGEGACTVTDTIRFVPRVPVLAPLLRPVFLRTFRHRHRRLRRRFGAA
jgi:ligand-binding SRPBCC domain-containing protein